MPESTSGDAASGAGEPRPLVTAFLSDWLSRLLILAAIAAFFLALAGYQISKTFAPEDIKGGSGQAYQIDLGVSNILLIPRALDGWSAARPMENGQPLGPKAKRLNQISGVGAGHYRQVGSVLHFSTRDNSDPRKNGRVYSADFRLHAKVWFAALIGLAALLAVWTTLGRRGDERLGAAISRRMTVIFFGLSPRLVLRAAGLAIGLIVLVLAFSYRDVAYAVASFFAGLAGAGVFIGLCAGAGVLVVRGATEEAAPLSRAVVQALVLLLLAMGLQRDVLSIAQIAVFGAGAGGYLWARRSSERMGKVQSWIARLTEAGPEADRRLVRAIASLSMVACFVSVLPNVIRFWDQSGWNDSEGYDRFAHVIATGMDVTGSGSYMPLYQYGLAAFYWAFGHFFFVQQVVNVGLAVVGAGLVTVAAWMLFRQPLAVLVAGGVAAVWRPLHHATWTTQIEGWYIPLFALSVVALIHYLQRHTMRALVLLALAAALIFNMRLQGAFYAAALGLAVLFVSGLDWRSRARQLVVFGLLFLVVGIGPWTIRNGLVEGRHSASSEQSISSLAFYNDPRIPFYGIRYWENLQEVVQEWNRKYPDAADRKAAQRQYFYDRVLNHTDYFVAAAPWRFLAFYGLLPPGALAKDGPRATDWAGEGWTYIRKRAVFWAPIAVSIIGWLVTIGSRLNILFGGLIVANVIVAFSTGFSEPRLAYPVAILHLLMGCAVFGRYAVDDPPDARQSAFGDWPRWAAAISLCLIVILPLAHVIVGRQFAFRPLMAEAWVREPTVSIDKTLPQLDLRDGGFAVDGKPVDDIQVGKRYRARFRVTSEMHSPRWICCRTDFIRRMSRPDGVTYFTSYLLGTVGGSKAVALRFTGTRVAKPIREGAHIEAEFRIDSNTGVSGYPAKIWANAEAAIVVRHPRQ